MKLRLHNLQAALRLVARLLFVFMVMNTTVANAGPPEPEKWADTSTSSIANTDGGNGESAANAIVIASADELAYFTKQVNAGGKELSLSKGTSIDKKNEADYPGGFSGYYFALSADIDLNGKTWTPIGNSNIKPFNGYFDGRGHTVDKMVVKEEATGYGNPAHAGFFGCVEDGTIQNLGVSLGDGGITATTTGGISYAGGIVGRLRGNAVIRNCYVTQSVTGGITATGPEVNAGGIVGYAAGNPGKFTVTVTHCYATVDVIATATNSQCYAGGITGFLYAGTLTYTYATGKVEVKGGSPQGAGGICGYGDGGNDYKIANNLALNTEVTIESGSNCHRILGYNDPKYPLTLSANYANPAMKLTAPPTADPAVDNLDGASTWADKMQDNLDAEWKNNNWTWPNTDQLPQLKVVNINDQGEVSGYDSWPGQPAQPALSISDYLKPMPTASAPFIANGVGRDGTTAEKAILIKDATELAYFAQQVNDGGLVLDCMEGGIDNSKLSDAEKKAKKGFTGYYFKLTDDITLNGLWTPIGNYTNRFCGNFDGDGHTVEGLKVDLTDDGSGDDVYAGLFGMVQCGTIQNLGVWLDGKGIVASGTGYVYAGGIVGWIQTVDKGNTAAILNCYVDAKGKGMVKATSTSTFYDAIAGGITGGVSGVFNGPVSLTHCYATVDVDATGSGSYVRAGGITGQISYGTLSYTYATGNVTAQGGTDSNYAGGICGQQANAIALTNCLALNKVVKATGTGTNSANRIKGDNATASGNQYNYANPDMKVTVGDKLLTADASKNLDTKEGGADTWLNTFEKDLKKEAPNETEWATTWSWPVNPTVPTDYKLPKLYKVKADGSPTTDLIAGQTDHNAIDFLPHNAWKDAAATAIENAGGNDGTDIQHPILIASAEELAYFAQQVNDGGKVLKCTNGNGINNNGITGFSGYYFALSANIDLMGGDWTPIGNGLFSSFQGNFDGQGHTVNRLKMDMKETGEWNSAHVGLFGYVTNGTLQNLGVHLADAGIKAFAEDELACAGGIASNINVNSTAGTVILRNCYVTGKGEVEATSTKKSAFAGGIVGYIESPGNGTVLLTHCYTTVDVTATVTVGNGVGLIQSQAGGIAGSFAGTLSYAYATGKITTKGGDQYTGGISGSALGQLTNCLALNPEISVGAGSYCNRIAGLDNGGVITASNYANPDMKLGSKTVTQTDAASLDGADTWLDTYAADLQGAAPNEWGNAWAGLGSANLPQLKIAKGEGASPTYDTWPNNPQPTLPAKDYLRDKPVAPPTPPVTEPDDDDEPTVYYTVTLPAVEGVTTDPVAGDYEVEAWDSFRFYLTVDTAYSQSEPVVTTSRGDVIAPRSSDGAYIVSYVRSDLEIFIAGIDKNPVANEAIRPDATRVWCADGALHISTSAPADVRIYTFAGTLHRAFRSDGGEQRVELAPGSYILRIGNESFKVIL